MQEENPINQPAVKKTIPLFVGIAIIITVAVILFGGVFVFQYFLNKSQPKVIQPQNQTAGPALNEVEGWKTYRNSQFEIKYPSSLCSINEETRQEGYYSYERKNVLSIGCPSSELSNLPVFSLISFYADNESKNIQNCFYGFSFYQNSVTTKHINGYDFKYIEFADAAMGGQRALNGNYAIINNQTCFNIDSAVRYKDLSFIEGASDQTFTDQEKAEYRQEIQNKSDLLKQVISTFKFTK